MGKEKRKGRRRERTPLSIIAILSARRAVESRCVMNTTVFVLFPNGDADMRPMVSNILDWAWASRDDVWKGKCEGKSDDDTAHTYGFIEQQKVNFGSISSHECAGDGDSLPLS